MGRRGRGAAGLGPRGASGAPPARGRGEEALVRCGREVRIGVAGAGTPSGPLLLGPRRGRLGQDPGVLVSGGRATGRVSAARADLASGPPRPEVSGRAWWPEGLGGWETAGTPWSRS